MSDHLHFRRRARASAMETSPFLSPFFFSRFLTPSSRTVDELITFAFSRARQSCVRVSRACDSAHRVPDLSKSDRLFDELQIIVLRVIKNRVYAREMFYIWTEPYIWPWIRFFDEFARVIFCRYLNRTFIVFKQRAKNRITSEKLNDNESKKWNFSSNNVVIIVILF